MVVPTSPKRRGTTILQVEGHSAVSFSVQNRLAGCCSAIPSQQQVKSSFHYIIISKQQLPTMKFPQQLYQVLKAAESEGFDHIISWNPDGRSFKVHNRDLFAQEILPKHFKTSNFKSYQVGINVGLGLASFARFLASNPCIPPSYPLFFFFSYQVRDAPR